MISMYAEYSGRTLYVALSSDNIEGAKNGDTLYEMDTGKRYVYNESNDAWDEQPEEGGGGYSADDNVSVLVENKSGVTITGYVVFYDDTLSCVMATVTSPNIFNNSSQKLTVLNQDGWFALRVRFNSEHTPVNVSYNGNNIPFETRGSNSNWYLRIKLPDDYTSTISIIIT